MERRLAAILAADVVGYSRLMERDEAGTLASLKAHRAEFVDPLIAEHDMAAFPGHKLAAWETYWHAAIEFQHQKDFDRLFDGLHKAGMPD